MGLGDDLRARDGERRSVHPGTRGRVVASVENHATVRAEQVREAGALAALAIAIHWLAFGHQILTFATALGIDVRWPDVLAEVLLHGGQFRASGAELGEGDLR